MRLKEIIVHRVSKYKGVDESQGSMGRGDMRKSEDPTVIRRDLKERLKINSWEYQLRRSGKKWLTMNRSFGFLKDILEANNPNFTLPYHLKAMQIVIDWKTLFALAQHPQSSSNPLHLLAVHLKHVPCK